MRTLARFEAPLQGDLLLDQRPYPSISSHEFACKVAVVNTSRVDFPFLRVRELVALGRHPYLGLRGRLRPGDWQQVDRAMELTGTTHLAEHPLNRCSDGERQAAMLARALAQDTPILLLDEVTAHLDFVNRRLIFRCLQRLVKEAGKLIFVATHELDLALKLADQVLLFHNQEILLKTPEEIEEEQLMEKVFVV